LDNLTHTLTAVAISQAGLNRKTRYATLAVIVGVNLPDIDVVAWTRGTATYLQYHRGLTHSLLGVTVLGALAGAGIYYLGRRAAPKASARPPNLRWLVVCGLLGAASHLLLDFTNSYGVRPFLPFSGHWYAWDIMFIVDPLLLFLLVAGLGVPALLRLMSEEMGARKPAYRAGAITALVAMALLWGVRDLAHRRVLSVLDSHAYAHENPRRVDAFPAPGNPFAWTGVVETDSSFHVVAVSALDDDVNVDDAEVFRKPEPGPALAAAGQTRTAAIFLRFARFPWSDTQEYETGYSVTLRDLRFASLRTGLRGFVVDVKLDKNLRVLSESFSFTGTPHPAGRQGSPGEGESPDVTPGDEAPRPTSRR
jgi:inner membrane protein